MKLPSRGHIDYLNLLFFSDQKDSNEDGKRVKQLVRTNQISTQRLGFVPMGHVAFGHTRQKSEQPTVSLCSQRHVAAVFY